MIFLFFPENAPAEFNAADAITSMWQKDLQSLHRVLSELAGTVTNMGIAPGGSASISACKSGRIFCDLLNLY